MKKTNIKGCISQEFFPPLPPLQKIKMHIIPILKICSYLIVDIWRLLNNQPQTTVLFKFSMNMFMKLNNCHAADAQWYMFYSKYIALPTYISFNLHEITSLPFTTEIGDPLCIPFFFLQLIRLFYTCKRI